MKEHQQHLKARDILYRYVKGRCTDEEQAWVEEWYKENYDSTFDLDSVLAEKHFADVWHTLESETGLKNGWTFKKIASVAASIAVAFGISVWYFVSYPHSETKKTAAQIQQPHIQAGRDQALLTLADGRTILLDSVAVGDHITARGIGITKMDDGTLSYQVDANSEHVAGAYNTITTPRGGQYKIVLPDHSIVWMNAASSLRFPVAFTGDTRTVELEGEGYFEVAHDKDKPFIVVSQNQRAIVKGTKFNVTAYRDDNSQITTLLEGSVLVKIAGNQAIRSDEVLLHPNEQAIIHNEAITKSKIDALAAVAWKNGKFVYNRTPLEAIMKQLARWYDVEIDYLEAVEGITFTGSISRFENIADVLRKISLTESVRFEIKERRIMVRH